MANNDKPRRGNFGLLAAAFVAAAPVGASAQPTSPSTGDAACNVRAYGRDFAQINGPDFQGKASITTDGNHVLATVHTKGGATIEVQGRVDGDYRNTLFPDYIAITSPAGGQTNIRRVWNSSMLEVETHGIKDQRFQMSLQDLMNEHPTGDRVQIAINALRAAQVESQRCRTPDATVASSDNTGASSQVPADMAGLRQRDFLGLPNAITTPQSASNPYGYKFAEQIDQSSVQDHVVGTADGSNMPREEISYRAMVDGVWHQIRANVTYSFDENRTRVSVRGTDVAGLSARTFRAEGVVILNGAPFQNMYIRGRDGSREDIPTIFNRSDVPPEYSMIAQIIERGAPEIRHTFDMRHGGALRILEDGVGAARRAIGPKPSGPGGP